jgi:hypothetical protein
MVDDDFLDNIDDDNSDELDQDIESHEITDKKADAQKKLLARKRIDELMERKRLKELLDDEDDW